MFIRINALDTQWGVEDLMAAAAAAPDAILIPKVASPDPLEMIGQHLLDNQVAARTRIWVMIETPLAILNIARDRRLRPRFRITPRRVCAWNQRSRQGDAGAHRARAARR